MSAFHCSVTRKRVSTSNRDHNYADGPAIPAAKIKATPCPMIAHLRAIGAPLFEDVPPFKHAATRIGRIPPFKRFP